MDILPLDVWGYLIDFIDNNEDKCCLLMTCKNISKCTFYFHSEIHIEKINKSEWFNNFTNIFVWNTREKLPASIKRIRFWQQLNISVDDFIPSTIIHLKFGEKFNKPIKSLPSSLIKLSFGKYFNQPIKGLLPSTLTQLRLGKYFNHHAIGVISSTIKHLTLGCKSNNLVQSYIPTSVTHLKVNYFDYYFIKCLPNSITHLIFKRRYYDYINIFYSLVHSSCPTSLTNVCFRNYYSHWEKDLLQKCVFGSKITLTFYQKNDDIYNYQYQ